MTQFQTGIAWVLTRYQNRQNDSGLCTKAKSKMEKGA